MSEITCKKRLDLLKQCISVDSRYFSAMTEENAKDYLSCVDTILHSDDLIILEASISNMYLITKNIEINEQEEEYKLRVAKNMIDHNLPNS